MLVKGDDISKYNMLFLQSHPKSLQAHIAVAKGLFALNKNRREEALKLATNLSKDLTDVTLEVSLY